MAKRSMVKGEAYIGASVPNELALQAQTSENFRLAANH